LSKKKIDPAALGEKLARANRYYSAEALLAAAKRGKRHVLNHPHASLPGHLAEKVVLAGQLGLL
jgi:hypothetical protein